MPTTLSIPKKGINPDSLTDAQRAAALQVVADFLYEFNLEEFLESALYLSYQLHENDVPFPENTIETTLQLVDFYKDLTKAVRA
jgi:hypothetical protein